MSVARPCLDCGAPTKGTRCPQHSREWARIHDNHNRQYDSPVWRRVRTRTLAAWRAHHGDWCPAEGGHVATDLTVDHIIPLAAGGAMLDPANLSVLCRVHNSRKGAS